MNIPFNKPPYLGVEDAYVLEAMRSPKISGDGQFGKMCSDWFAKTMANCHNLLTPSCTHALELAALLLEIQPGDEVIMPSYTFVSTANAFALRGAKIVFVDIHPETMNIDERAIQAAITPRTRAIVPVHYGGVPCEMDQIMNIAQNHGLYVIEDAAQAIFSRYNGKPLGTIGHLGAFSFHETKNITSGGEGGLLLINSPEFLDRAEIIREKGTNRSQFFRGVVDKYTWVDIGSSLLPSELQAAYLWGQLQGYPRIQDARKAAWKKYHQGLAHLQELGKIQLPDIPNDECFNAHMFYIKTHDLNERMGLQNFLHSRGIHAVFHYVPLHTAPAGQRYARFSGIDNHTTRESERLLRLPLFYGLSNAEQEYIIGNIAAYFSGTAEPK